MTATDDLEPFWMVDLEQVYTIRFVTVFARSIIEQCVLDKGKTYIYVYYITIGC